MSMESDIISHAKNVYKLVNREKLKGTPENEIVKRALEMYDARVVKLWEWYSRQADYQEPACKAGCHWCCVVPVQLESHELGFIVNEIRNRFNQDEIAALIAEIETVLKLRSEDQLPFCPFLKEKLCSIYDIRPMGCRQCSSTSAETCKDYAEKKGSNPVAIFRLPMEYTPKTQEAIVLGLEGKVRRIQPIEFLAGLLASLKPQCSPNSFRPE